MSRHLRGLRGATFVVVAALLALTTLASCSSGGSEDATGGASGSESRPDMAPAAREQGGDTSDSLDAGNASAPANQKQNGLALEPRALIKTGTVSLRSLDVADVLQQITVIVAASRGEIANETTTTDKKGNQVYSQLELRVPVAKFDSTLDEITGLSVFATKTRSSEDVTTQVVDVRSRVRTAEDSLASLQRLFVRATELGEIITLERELSQRQADLESLLAQQRTLAQQTEMSTITVTVSRTSVPKPKPQDDDRAGFVSGLKQGWDAFTTFVVGTGHAIGVALPLGSMFAFVALLGWVVVRRWLPHREPQPTE